MRRTQIVSDTDDQVAKFATVSARLNRVLMCVVITQTLLTTFLLIAVGFGSYQIVAAVRDVDLNSVSAILTSATHTAFNIETASAEIVKSIAFATEVMNTSVSAVDSVNQMLQHPVLQISMQT